MLRRTLFGTRWACMSFAPVTGDVTCCPSQCAIALFSYVCPSAAMTGSTSNTCTAKGHQKHIGPYSVLNTTNCTARTCQEDKSTQLRQAAARFHVRSKLRSHLQQKQSIVDNTIIACTHDTGSLVTQTGKVTFVIGQQRSLFSAGTLTAAAL